MIHLGNRREHWVPALCLLRHMTGRRVVWQEQLHESKHFVRAKFYKFRGDVNTKLIAYAEMT